MRSCDVLVRAKWFAFVPAVGAGLLLAACSGNTTPASNVAGTSATLNGVGGCDVRCYWSFKWKRPTDSSWQQTPFRGPAGSTNHVKVPLNEPISGLAPSTRYDYQICGNENASSPTSPAEICVGPDGYTTTVQSFTTPPTAFADSFESGNFDAGGWYYGQDESDYGHVAVVDPANESPPVPRYDGTKVARFEVTPADLAAGRYHAKIYKMFGSDIGNADARPPEDVSGTYSAWYFLPAAYSVPSGTWVNIFQFKEQYATSSSPTGTSDPLWWLQLADCTFGQGQAPYYNTPPPQCNRSDQPVVFMAHWGGGWNGDPATRRTFATVPLGRWFQVKAVLHQSDRIDFYVDGNLLSTALASEYPVSPSHGSDSRWWIWGVGNYSTGINGPLYIDQASYTP